MRKESAPRVPIWEQVDDEALLRQPPRIEAVRNPGDDDLRAWARLSWDRIGAALGMKRQSAWKRFAG